MTLWIFRLDMRPSFSFQLAIIAPRINLIGYDTATVQS